MNQPSTEQKSLSKSFLYRNSLTIVFMLLFLIFLTGQIYTGLKEHNDLLAENGRQPMPLLSYLTSGHFLQATFENMESEFLQMALFVILSIWLRQQGSSESKDLEEEEDVDKEPVASPGAPWPVRKGGIYLKIYKNSLSIAFLLLFLGSFIVHLYGSWKDFNTEQVLKNKPTVELSGFMWQSKFWFESFQNWQSEFLSVAAIVFLTVYLRQKGSAQSKPVDMPHHEMEK